MALAGGLAAFAIGWRMNGGVAGRAIVPVCRQRGHVQGVGHRHEGQAKDQDTAQEDGQEVAHQIRPVFMR